MTDPYRLFVAALAVLVVASLATTIAVAGQPAPGTATPTPTDQPCQNELRYDDFRTENETVQAAANGSATEHVQNTKVSVEQNKAFVRINAKNPNGYCVRFTVEIDRAVVAPSELGRVDSVDENYTADWHAMRDFSTNETYTEVTFTLPPASAATFAPTKLRVKSLEWAGEAKAASDGLLPDIDLFGSDPVLEENRYFFSGNNSTSIITVPLENSSSGGRVTDWHAVYKLPESDWRKVDEDSDAPVFYRVVEGGQAVQFIFNDPDAQVRFTANPGWFESTQHQWDTYWGGWDAISDLFAFTTVAVIPPVFAGWRRRTPGGEQ